jgi:hypothetical protein
VLDAAAAAAAVAGVEDTAAALKEPKAPKRVAKSLAFMKARKLETHTRAAALIRRAEAASASNGDSSSSRFDQDALPTGASKDQGTHKQQQQPTAGSLKAAAVSTAASSKGSASGAAAAAAAALDRKAKHAPVAAQLSLRQNWCTQRNILAVANAITDVLYHLFPGTVDKLPPEISEVGGAAPVLLQPGRTNDPLLLVFRADSDASSSSNDSSSRVPTSMNAKTAVLVRDDAAAAPVRQLVGDGALVLTVAEAKGLEYEVGLTVGCMYFVLYVCYRVAQYLEPYSSLAFGQPAPSVALTSHLTAFCSTNPCLLLHVLFVFVLPCNNTLSCAMLCSMYMPAAGC